MIFVFNAAHIRFNAFTYIVKPFAMCFFCCQITSALTRLITCSSALFETVIYLCTSGIIFIALYELDKKMYAPKAIQKFVRKPIEN